MGGGVILLPPSAPDPGDGWYRVTFGPEEEVGCWVNADESDVLTFPSGDVVQGKDIEEFYNKFPEYRDEEE